VIIGQILFFALSYDDSVKFTGVVADSALDALSLVQMMNLFLVSCDSFLGTFLGANMTPRAGLLVHFIVKEGFADPSRAFLVPDVRLVLIAKV